MCSARREFEEQHRTDLEAGQCLLVFFETRDLELVLVPVMVAEGGPQLPFALLLPLNRDER